MNEKDGKKPSVTGNDPQTVQQQSQQQRVRIIHSQNTQSEGVVSSALASL
jgi:hypothetical protein